MLGNIRKTEVASATKLWVSDADPPLPDKAPRVSSVLSIFPGLNRLDLDSFVRQREGDPSVMCAITKPVGLRKEKSGYCFDVAAGRLVEYIAPQTVHEHVDDFSCNYSDFRKFNDQWFPFGVECLLSGHRQMEVHVTELQLENSNDETLFGAPVRAVELDRCSEAEVPPKAELTPDPATPFILRESGTSVTLRFIVDVKGRTQDVRVVQSGEKPFDAAAVDAVRRWRFKPATCGGVPISTQAEVRVKFPKFRH